MTTTLQRLAAAADGWAPNPGQVGAIALLIVSLVLDSQPLGWVALAVAVYGIAYDLTSPDLEHVYCPCSICSTPPADTDTDGGLR